MLHRNRACRASAMTPKLLKDVPEGFINIFVRLFAQNYSELVNTRLFQRCVVKIFEELFEILLRVSASKDLFFSVWHEMF